ncbi:strictosidine synthase [Scenedesmus sp. NREL 46B-D3]|nr:strictosidine synthase [Scenedesmus sp. NREL 46B-D3]
MAEHTSRLDQGATTLPSSEAVCAPCAFSRLSMGGGALEQVLQPICGLQGRFQVRTKLNATKLFDGQISGSESVTVAPDGRFIMLDRYGAVREAREAGGGMVLNPKPLAHLGPGRPLGAQFDGNGNLIICDAFKGLIMLEAVTSRVIILANRVSASSPLHPNSALMYTNDLDIAPDGTIYFTDSVDVNPHRNAQHNNNVIHIVTILGKPGFYDTVKGWGYGFLQGLPRGRLLAYYPHNKTTHVISHALYYSNGVALSADGTYAAVCETDRLRVLKVFLPPHPRAGSSEVLIDGLPGTPDGISRTPGGRAFWVALVSNIPPSSKWFGPALVRGLLARIPENRRPRFPAWGAVLKVSDKGQLLQWLVDLNGETASKIPSAHEEGGRLYFGNLAGKRAVRGYAQQ